MTSLISVCIPTYRGAVHLPAMIDTERGPLSDLYFARSNAPALERRLDRSGQ